MVLIFITLNLLMVFSAHLAASHYTRGYNLSERIITTFLFYMSQVTLTVLILGALIKNLGTTSLLLVNVTISLAIIVLYRKNMKSSIIDTWDKLREFSQAIGHRGDYLLYFLLFLFMVQILATLIKIYYLPPFVGDVFSYHLHPVADWFQQGHILSYTDTPVARANENPLGTKLIHLWFLSFWGDTTWIELPQYLFGIILSLTVYAILLKMNLQHKNALRYAILIYFMPTIILQSRTCQDHLIFAACIFLTLNYVTDVIYLDRHKQILPLFMALGLLFAIKKHSALVIFGIFMAILLSRGFNRHRILEFIKKNYRILAIGATGALGYGSYFLISKKKLYQSIWIRYSGNVTPAIILSLLLSLLLLILLWGGLRKFKIGTSFNKKQRVIPIVTVSILLLISGLVIKNRVVLRPFFFGHTSPTMLRNHDFSTKYPAFDHPLIKNLLAFPFRIKDIGLYTAYTPDLLQKSGFGIQFFAFGLIAYIILIPLCVFKKEYRDSIMGFILLFSIFLLAIYYCVYFSWANYRSFLFFGVIGLMGWSFLLEKQAAKRLYLRYIDGLLVIMILFSAATCFFEGNMSPQSWKTLFTLDQSKERTSIQYSSLMEISTEKESWKFIDHFIPAEESIGFSSGGAAWIFPYFDYQLKKRIYFIKSLPGFATEPKKKNGIVYNILIFSEDFKISLKQRGIHFIHLNNEGTPYKEKVFMPEGMDNVYKVTKSLYYVKW